MSVQLRIDDVEIEAQEGQFVLDVARRVGFDIPSLCHHEAVPPIGACRICLVEVTVGIRPSQLTTSCNLPVEQGMEVVTASPLIHQHRAVNLELLLARAPSSSRLRELALQAGVLKPRFKPLTGQAIKNCVLCELCVRVCAKLGHSALTTVGRGDNKRIGLPFNKPADTCVGCASCVSVCPTDCILIKDTPQNRTIWGQSFAFQLCKVCKSPVLTARHRDFAIATKGLPEDYYDVCESCKQVAASKRLASVVW